MHFSVCRLANLEKFTFAAVLPSVLSATKITKILPSAKQAETAGSAFVRLTAASLLTGDRHEIADDIGRAPRLDDGEIRRRYRRKAAIGKLHDEICCHLQRIQSLFRFIARMRRHAMPCLFKSYNFCLKT